MTDPTATSPQSRPDAGQATETHGPYPPRDSAAACPPSRPAPAVNAGDGQQAPGQTPAARGRVGRGLRWLVVHAIVLETLCGGAFAAEKVPVEPAAASVRDLYPLITTPALFEVRDFYVRHFGFEVAFQASWFVYLLQPGEDGGQRATLAFMHPDHPSRPPGPEAFDGRGMILTVEVGDATRAYARLKAHGAPIVHPLTDEDWGQRRFMTRDPAGVLIDVVEQIDPKPGYWERYPAPGG